MKLSEFQAGYKTLGIELAKILRADIFETTPAQRQYSLEKLLEMSKAIVQADKICEVLNATDEADEDSGRVGLGTSNPTAELRLDQFAGMAGQGIDETVQLATKGI